MKQQRKAYHSLRYLSRFACCLSTVSHSHPPADLSAGSDLLSYFIILFFSLSFISVLFHFILFFLVRMFSPFPFFARFCTYNFSRFPANAAQKFLVVTFNFMPFNSLKAERVKRAKNWHLKPCQEKEYCNYVRVCACVCVCEAQRNLPQDTLYNKNSFRSSIWRLLSFLQARPRKRGRAG